MEEYANLAMKGGRRVRLVFDDEYSPVGSYRLDTEQETLAAERWELERLADGRLVALGMIVERRVETCAHCGRGAAWVEDDACYGIVIEPNDDAIREYVEWSGYKLSSE